MMTNQSDGTNRFLVDLHTHSTASDGQYTPTELVGLAKAHGLSMIALTDHDTVGGVKEATEVGAQLGLRVIRGVELSAKECHTFHLLGYHFAEDAAHINAFLGRMQGGRDDRKYKIIDYLKGEGVTLDLAEVEAEAGGVVGRPHFAKVMIRNGWVETWREAFDRYLDTDKYHETVETGKPYARECVEVLKGDGAKVSLAHPYQMGLDDERLEAWVRQLADWGLDAIECYYPEHTPEMTEFYLSLAKKDHLHATGGSDFHGEKVKPNRPLASLELDVDWLLGNG